MDVCFNSSFSFFGIKFPFNIENICRKKRCPKPPRLIMFCFHAYHSSFQETFLSPRLLPSLAVVSFLFRILIRRILYGSFSVAVVAGASIFECSITAAAGTGSSSDLSLLQLSQCYEKNSIDEATLSFTKDLLKRADGQDLTGLNYLRG